MSQIEAVGLENRIDEGLDNIVDMVEHLMSPYSCPGSKLSDADKTKLRDGVVEAMHQSA